MTSGETDAEVMAGLGRSRYGPARTGARTTSRRETASWQSRIGLGQQESPFPWWRRATTETAVHKTGVQGPCRPGLPLRRPPAAAS